MALLSGTITESLPYTDWIVRLSNYVTGAWISDIEVDTTSSGAYEAGYSHLVCLMVTCFPKTGNKWLNSNETAVGDYCFPTDPATTPYFFKCSARSGDFGTGPNEPSWDTTVGNETTDGNVTWVCQGRLIQPISQGPLTDQPSS